MHYLIVGFTYKNSTLELRESLNLSNEDNQKLFLRPLSIHHDFDELMLSNTCNRIEIIAYVKDITLAKEIIFEHLKIRSGQTIKTLQEQADIYSDKAAIHHLFSVAASLDSLVVGETQIVGQLRDALKYSQQIQISGKAINKALTEAFKCASKVRSSTSISSKPVSIASIAVLQAQDEFGSLEGLNALVIGSGDMSRIACQNLLKYGVSVTLINRTLDKAKAIQSEVEGITVEPYEKLQELINSNELLFTATSTKEPIITQKMVEGKIFNRVWLDLAVPRDIAEIKDEDIKVIIVDDLVEIATKNLELRSNEARSSYGIIGEQTDLFFSDLDDNDMEPLIKDMYIKAFQAVSLETNRAIKKGFIPEEFHVQAEKMGTQMMKRFLHTVSDNMRAANNTKSVEIMMSNLAYLLDIDHDQNNETQSKEA
jgi:glutamyl-tRNA reductase